MARIPPTFILDRGGSYARVGDVSIMIVAVPKWTVETSEAIFRDTLELTGDRTPHSLVQMLDATPSPAARKRMAELTTEMEANEPYEGERRVAVISSSELTRGLMTAWRWLTQGNVCAFAPSAVRDAALYLSEPAFADDIVAAYTSCMSLMERRAAGF